MGLKIVTQPAAEPVTLAETKLHLRVDHNDEDGLINSLIKLARQDVERMCNLALITQTWDWSMDAWPDRLFSIPLWPLQNVTSIRWKNLAGTETTIDAGNYIVDASSRPGRVSLNAAYSWPTDELYPLAAVTIQFTAGFGADGASVPERYRQAILLLVGHYYENREAVLAGSGINVQLLPLGVTALLAEDIAWAR